MGMDLRNGQNGIRFRSIVGLLLIGMLFWITEDRYSRSDKKVACHRVREAMDQFTADKKTSPKSLEEIIRGGYLRKLPNGVRALEDCVGVYD
jgi:hypothetical protein